MRRLSAKLSPRFLLGSAAALIGCGIISVAACGPRPPCPPRDPAHVKKMVRLHLEDALDDIDATEEQTARIWALTEPILDEVGRHAQELQSEHALVAAELLAERPDRAKLHAMLDQRLDTFRTTAHQILDAIVSAREVLTPAQVKEIATGVTERQARCSRR